MATLEDRMDVIEQQLRDITRSLIVLLEATERPNMAEGLRRRWLNP